LPVAGGPPKQFHYTQQLTAALPGPAAKHLCEIREET
jgi:hypothetical protein